MDNIDFDWDRYKSSGYYSEIKDSKNLNSSINHWNRVLSPENLYKRDYTKEDYFNWRFLVARDVFFEYRDFFEKKIKRANPQKESEKGFIELDKIHWLVHNNQEKQEVVFVPFVFNETKNKIKTLNNDKIYEIDTTSQEFQDRVKEKTDSTYKTLEEKLFNKKPKSYSSMLIDIFKSKKEVEQKLQLHAETFEKSSKIVTEEMLYEKLLEDYGFEKKDTDEMHIALDRPSQSDAHSVDFLLANPELSLLLATAHDEYRVYCANFLLANTIYFNKEHYVNLDELDYITKSLNNFSTAEYQFELAKKEIARLKTVEDANFEKTIKNSKKHISEF